MSRTELLLTVSSVRQVLAKVSLDVGKRQPILDRINQLENIIRDTNFGL